MWSYLIFLGAGIQLLGIASYTRQTLKGNTKPNRVTWLMWAIAPLIAAVAAWSDGAGWGALPVFISGSSALIVFLASFVNLRAYWKLGIWDYLCGSCSLLALILWAITKEPFVAVALAILSDIFASFPTFTKSWKYPETETSLAYTTGLFNAMTSFIALENWNLTSVGFPIYWCFTNLLIISFLYRKYLTASKQLSTQK